jgi:hypothetical protein
MRPLIVTWGGGVNSTAMLVGMKQRGIRPDRILFADTGGEKPDRSQASLRESPPDDPAGNEPRCRTGHSSLPMNISRMFHFHMVGTHARAATQPWMEATQ